MMVCEQCCELGLIEIFLTVALAGAQPQISYINMRIVLSPLLVQQLCFWLPVEPAHVKGTVAVVDDVLSLEATLAEIITDSFSLEARRALHSAWRNAAHLCVTDCLVKVLLHTPHQSGAVDIGDHI